MFTAILLVLAGFVLLIKGADALVNGSCAMAKRLGVSNLVIGLTVVAFGTSAPELVVCIFAVIKGNGEISIGNIIGSNMFNTYLILGVAGLIAPLAIHKALLKRDLPFYLFVTFALLVIITTNNSHYLVSRMEAFVLGIFFIAYLHLMCKTSRMGHDPVEDKLKELDANKTLPAAVLYIAGGLAGLIIGGELVVRNSVIIALSMGVSEGLIGLTIVAVGTSLPELATSVVAVRKNETDIAVGNVIGSNIFNICLILGFTSMIQPIASTQSFISDVFILSAAAVLITVFMITGKKKQIDRWEAAVFLAVYIVYVVYIIHRG